MLDIGLHQLGFNQIRDKHKDFLLHYGIVPQEDSNQENEGAAGGGDTSGGKDGRPAGEAPPQQESAESGSGTPKGENTPPQKDKNQKESDELPPPTSTSRSTQLGTPTYVKGILKKFNPKGNRQKVVAIKAEMCALDIKKTPMAFCFLLRSAFEISAKEYCSENGIETDKLNKNGSSQSKTLVELLNVVVKHLTNDNKNVGMQKVLHGAKTELAKPVGVLSVTSMNQLVHNSTFSIASSDICTVFGNIYPLLEAMN